MNHRFFQNKSILITGGNGYLACNVIHQLRDTPCLIVRFDREGTRWHDLDFGENIQIQNREGDLRDSSIWDDLLRGVDIVYHFGAQTSIKVSNTDPIGDLAVNAIPLLNMLEKCREKKLAPTLVFSGTVTEAGFTQDLPVGEGHADRPITIYDIHKLTAENYIKHYSAEGFVKGVILRLANVYGPGPKSSSADRGILNQMIGRALKREDLTVYGSGEFLRDYVYIEDVARAFIFAAENIAKISGQHFVIGTGNGMSIQEAFQRVAERVARKTGIVANVTTVAPPPNLPAIERRNFVADISRYSQLTGWRPAVSFDQGIDMTIDWYLKK